MTRDKRCHTLLRLLTVLFFAAVCVWGITEAGYGLLQVLGWRMSRHSLYALTGHFNNPGPYGGFIACVMAVAAAWVMVHTPLSFSVLSPTQKIGSRCRM